MKKFATIAGLALMAQQAMGTCADNWVKTAISITGEGDTTSNNDPLTGGNTYNTCGTAIGGGLTCCTAAEVNTFQTKATALVETLKTAVTTRDQYILDRRGDVLNVRDSLNSIQESITKLSGDSNAGTALIAAFLSSYEDTIATFTEDFTDLKAGFITLQKNRVTCFNALVKAQVAVWCAACGDGTPSGFAASGNSGAITFGDTFKDYLAGACSAYVASAVEQSGILSLYLVADSLTTLASALSKLADGDIEGASTELQEFITDYDGITVPTNELQRVAMAPTTCTSTDCDWPSTLLADGALDTDLATVGGPLSVARILQEVPAGRMLQVNSDPDDEATGITVDFPENPGNVDNDQNSAVRNGAIACAITALAALF